MNRIMEQKSQGIDFVVGQLRSQSVLLYNTLEDIGRNHRYGDDYIMESLKTTEISFRRLQYYVEIDKEIILSWNRSKRLRSAFGDYDFT